MKNKLIFIAIITLFSGILFIYNIEGFETHNKSISIKSLDTINYKEVENIKSTKKESEYDSVRKAPVQQVPEDPVQKL